MSDIGDDDYDYGSHKLAVIFVIDISHSSYKETKALSDSFNNFIETYKDKDSYGKEVDVATITFDTDAKANCSGFSDLKGISKVEFNCRNSTNMNDALRLANQMARERVRLYKINGMMVFKPWIILITDGYPNDLGEYESVVAEIKERETNGKHRTFALGIGEHFDRNLLLKLTNGCLAIDDSDYSRFFSWLDKSFDIYLTARTSPDQPFVSMDQELQDMWNCFHKD